MRRGGNGNRSANSLTRNGAVDVDQEKIFDERLGCWLEKPSKNVDIEFDPETVKWFKENPGETAWMTDCPECNRRYIVELGHHCYEKEKG